jgi:hypothetical protein
MKDEATPDVQSAAAAVLVTNSVRTSTVMYSRKMSAVGDVSSDASPLAICEKEGPGGGARRHKT